MGWKKVIGAVAGVLGASCAALSVGYFEYAICRPSVPKHEDDLTDPVVGGFWKQWQQERAWIETLPKKKLEILSYDGLRLVGTLIPAETPSKKTVIAIHGYKSCGYREYATFVRFYHEMGCNVLLPDNRAHGGSEGRYIGFGWLDRLDTLEWIQRMLQEYGTDSQIVLQGVSMGAATVLMTSGEILPVQVKAIVADCPYTSVKEQFEHNLDQQGVPHFPLMQTTDLLCQRIAGYGYEEASALRQVQKSATPTLFITGDADDFVPTEMTHRLYEACTAEKDLFVVPGARHAEAHTVDQAGYEQRVREFVGRYLS